MDFFYHIKRFFGVEAKANNDITLAKDLDGKLKIDGNNKRQEVLQIFFVWNQIYHLFFYI